MFPALSVYLALAYFRRSSIIASVSDSVHHMVAITRLVLSTKGLTTHQYFHGHQRLARALDHFNTERLAQAHFVTQVSALNIHIEGVSVYSRALRHINTERWHITALASDQSACT